MLTRRYKLSSLNENHLKQGNWNEVSFSQEKHFNLDDPNGMKRIGIRVRNSVMLIKDKDELIMWKESKSLSVTKCYRQIVFHLPTSIIKGIFYLVRIIHHLARLILLSNKLNTKSLWLQIGLQSIRSLILLRAWMALFQDVSTSKECIIKRESA